jgi:hypothetical protein
LVVEMTSSRISRGLAPVTAPLKRVIPPTEVQGTALMQLDADQLNDAAWATGTSAPHSHPHSRSALAAPRCRRARRANRVKRQRAPAVYEDISSLDFLVGRASEQAAEMAAADSWSEPLAMLSAPQRLT